MINMVVGQVLVQGVVTDENSIPIPGVAVFAEGTSNIVYTDSVGRYSITDLTAGLHIVYFLKFGWLGVKKEISIASRRIQLDTVKLWFGDVDNDGAINVKDVALIHEETSDSVSNKTRYMDSNTNGIVDSEDESKTMSAVETAGVQCPEWLISKPDYVTFIPAVSNPKFATNQHYLITKLKNGRLLGIWTAGFMESSDNQSMLCHWSDDNGKTWSKYVVIDGPQTDGKTASWGFSIYVPERDRIYVFYNKDVGSRIYNQGVMKMKYSTDGGENWSAAYTYTFEAGEYSPKDGSPPYWWVYQNPIRVGNSYLVGFTEILSRYDDIFYSTEIRFLRFDNILTVDDPTALRITTFPSNGRAGLRGSYRAGTDRSTLQEPSLVQLSDGRLLCVMRSGQGFPYYSLSADSGKTWSIPMGLRFGDGLAYVPQPLASCPLFSLGNGNYVLIFHNNSVYANGGTQAADWQKNRTPAFLLFGKEDLTKTQPITFGTPIRFLENYVRPVGPQNRTEIATYPSMTEVNGEYILWYPDRKHFLLGKKIPQPSY
ncbi:MAG: carboxypeptidase-like regulatory domain-containing protein [Stygiobacter sp.]